MRLTRTPAATLGAGLAVAVLAAVLAASPWRPGGWATAAVVALVLLPASAGLGAAAGLRLGRHPHERTTAQLAAAGAPVLALFTQFGITALASTRAPGLQHLLALVLGGAGAAALAARFTGVEER